MDLNQVEETILISELLCQHPEAMRVFIRHGMACVGCPLAKFETLDQAARVYCESVEQLLGEIRGVLPLG